MGHVTLTKWLLAPWSAVQPGDVVAEIETDKANVEYEAQDEMILANYLIQEGTEEIPVGHPIMSMAQDSKDVAAFEMYEGKEIPEMEPIAPADFLVHPQAEKGRSAGTTGERKKQKVYRERYG